MSDQEVEEDLEGKYQTSFNIVSINNFNLRLIRAKHLYFQ